MDSLVMAMAGKPNAPRASNSSEEAMEKRKRRSLLTEVVKRKNSRSAPVARRRSVSRDVEDGVIIVRRLSNTPLVAPGEAAVRSAVDQEVKEKGATKADVARPAEGTAVLPGSPAPSLASPTNVSLLPGTRPWPQGAANSREWPQTEPNTGEEEEEEEEGSDGDGKATPVAHAVAPAPPPTKGTKAWPSTSKPPSKEETPGNEAVKAAATRHHRRSRKQSAPPPDIEFYQMMYAKALRDHTIIEEAFTRSHRNVLHGGSVRTAFALALLLPCFVLSVSHSSPPCAPLLPPL